MVATIQSSLRERQHYLIHQLANCIEEHWQQYLTLSPYQIPEDLGYVEGNLEGEKLIIENRCYQTPEFRKLHLELARVGDRLDILHCVMFPRTNYPLPIFGVDLVGSQGQIGAAIVDLSPGNTKGILAQNYQQVLAALPAVQFSQPRQLPAWGDIFSEFCLFVRPINSQEEALFLKQVNHFLTLHCQIAITTPAVSSPVQQREILKGHHYYCTKQQQNDKTRRVLEKSLGKAWTDRYMTTMLFDAP
ncbi:phycocyanobilin:ferredoxin oxidoreductase [Stanieria cyanosphaera PCC 7437]|uniref:Phycocyanobilin:ferredoxin oxidoreductase n=1 Tax=Stanieria cyanosphaera (strain ATCC 29371 / PCC 7437) TaxID=111780 RepID=K9XWL7_STAC7|nr:phycocyanobilin:ferredoxin oxidoreductase [Stanieria cyanosphaera]AFZ36481.1 phycocyanobilin:ferredoxin oxidoreductase [Stanieria cyanosphaera PCC 7437]